MNRRRGASDKHSLSRCGRSRLTSAGIHGANTPVIFVVIRIIQTFHMRTRTVNRHVVVFTHHIMEIFVSRYVQTVGIGTGYGIPFHVETL